MKKYFFTRTKKVISIFFALLFLSFLQGCMYYYKVQTANKVTPLGFKVYNSLDKYFILHQGDSAWHLSGLGTTDNTFIGVLSGLPGNRYKYKVTKPKRGNRYKNTKKHDESYILNEVHLYLKDSLVPKLHSGDHIPLAFSSIQIEEVYQKAKGRTNASWLIPSLGGPILAVGIVAIIIGASINGGGLGGGGFSITGK